MRKILSLFVLTIMFASIGNMASATHLMGGEITAIQVHDSTYLITLTTYRDTLGIPMDSIANFEVKDTSGSTVMTFSIPYDTAISGGRLRLYPYGVEVYIFSDTIQLPGSGTYHISFTDCCRNGAIQNLSNPLSENMYLTTMVTHFDTVKNSTPFFLVQPVIFLPRNTSWSYNPLPFDLDGDSLVWSLDVPLTSFNSPCAGYSAPPSTTAGTFSINSANGSITWTASNIGNFDATVLVEEYRNGIKIGEIRRDMQFIVVNPVGNMARMTNMNQVPKDNMSNYHVKLNAKSRYNFSFYAEDPDSADIVSMQAFGEPFMFKQGKRASFFVSKTGKTYGNEIEGTFIWKPEESMIRDKPYIVVYRVSDGFNTVDYTVLYTVEGPISNTPTGINSTEMNLNFNIFPNPAEYQISIEFYQEQSGSVQLKIYDVNGQLKLNSNFSNVKSGNNLLFQNLNLPNGIYILSLSDGNRIIHHERLEIFK